MNYFHLEFDSFILWPDIGKELLLIANSRGRGIGSRSRSLFLVYHHTLLRTKAQQVAGRAKAVLWCHQWSRLLLSSCSGILWESFWFQSQNVVVRRQLTGITLSSQPPKEGRMRNPKQLPRMPLRQLPFTFGWKVFVHMVGIWMRLRLLLCFTKSAFSEWAAHKCYCGWCIYVHVSVRELEFICGGQRTVLAVSSCFPFCLRWSLLCLPAYIRTVGPLTSMNSLASVSYLCRILDMCCGIWPYVLSRDPNSGFYNYVENVIQSDNMFMFKIYNLSNPTNIHWI